MRDSSLSLSLLPASRNWLVKISNASRCRYTSIGYPGRSAVQQGEKIVPCSPCLDDYPSLDFRGYGRTARLRILSVVFSLLGGSVSVPTEALWTITGAVAAIIGAAMVFVFGVYEFVWQPMSRRHRLKHPCKAWFHIPPLTQRRISYAVQDNRPHFVEELTLAANSTTEIEFLFIPSVTFPASEIYFGCDDGEVTKRPIIQSYRVLFLERGTPEESPETHPETNWADEHKLYHLRKSRTFTRKETYSNGCKIQTKESGLFKFSLFFVGDELGQPKNKLFIRVENNPATRMRCKYSKHRWQGCFIQPTGNK